MRTPVTPIEQALRKYLLTQPPITSLVQQRIGVRGEFGREVPALVLELYSYVPDRCHDGPSGLAAYGLQILCGGATREAARNLADTVRNVLDGLTGSVGGLRLDNCECDVVAANRPEPEAGSESFAWQAICDVTGICASETG